MPKENVSSAKEDKLKLAKDIKKIINTECKKGIFLHNIDNKKPNIIPKMTLKELTIKSRFSILFFKKLLFNKQMKNNIQYIDARQNVYKLFFTDTFLYLNTSLENIKINKIGAKNKALIIKRGLLIFLLKIL